jgi:hypothetical protein
MADNPLETTNTQTPQRRVYDLSDKLKIINEALINTGNNPVNVYDDTSDEWIAADNAFEQNVLWLLGQRDWNFGTAQTGLQRLGDSNYPGFKDVFAKPVDCIQLINVWRVDDQERLDRWVKSYSHAMADVTPPSLTYTIIGDNIHTTAPMGVSCKYMPFPVGAQEWSVGFVGCLRAKIEANLYRSLNEDLNTAAAWEKYADELMRQAISRNAQEDPTKAMFKSRLEKTRMIRKFGNWLK